MKINTLKLQDFRCFKEFEINFSPLYNVHLIIAENMVGKSALMAALRLAANTYTSGLKTEQQIRISDHRIMGDNPISDITPDVTLTIVARITGPAGRETESKWLKYKTKPKGERTKIEILHGPDPRKESKAVNKLAGDGRAVQPLFGYIGTEYIHVESPNAINWEVNGKSIDGYKGCFEDKSIKKFLFRWIARIDGLLGEISRKPILKESYKDVPENALYVFKKAVTSVLPDVVEIEWSNDAGEPVVKFANGDIRLFSMLSDGYRYLILLAGELATRAFILNKHLGKEVLQHIHGQVMIDEFGIHLHPSLQTNALHRLCQTFPGVQFIISTHSPMLLNGLKKEQVHILSIAPDGERTVTNPDADVIGLGANEILTKIFGLETTMDSEFLRWNEEYAELFRKKAAVAGLTQFEDERFAELTQKLAPLRLDPALEVTTEDPVSKLVKQQLASRSTIKSNQVNDSSTVQSLEQEVGSILDHLFSADTQ